MNNEPLTEIHQLKGTSETHPVLSPNDEFANYEILTYLLGGVEPARPRLHGSYIREAYQNGLAMEESAGLQPVQVRRRGRERLAQHGRPVYGKRTTSAATGSWTPRRKARLSGQR